MMNSSTYNEKCLICDGIQIRDRRRVKGQENFLHFSKITQNNVCPPFQI